MTDVHTARPTPGETDYATADVYAQRGIAEALLSIVAEHMAPGPGGCVRVRLTPGTAERIRSVVHGLPRVNGQEPGIAARVEAGLF